MPLYNHQNDIARDSGSLNIILTLVCLVGYSLFTYVNWLIYFAYMVSGQTC